MLAGGLLDSRTQPSRTEPQASRVVLILPFPLSQGITTKNDCKRNVNVNIGCFAHGFEVVPMESSDY